MSLNKIRLLNEEQLIKAIRENGYEEIANILKNKGLNGQLFLECDELQTISWRLSRAQQKSIFTFIDEVKSNPSILVKSEYTIRQIKPKPALPFTPKPSSTITPTPKIPKPNVSITSKPSFSSSKSSVTKRPQNNADLPVSQYKAPTNNVDSNEFRKKMGAVLGNLGSSTQSPSPKSNDSNLKFQQPSSLEQNQPFEYMKKPVKPLPTEPAEFAEIIEKTKITKPFLPEPPKTTSTKERPACPLPTETSEEKSELIPDNGYLTPKDLDIDFISAAAGNSKSFLVSKFLHKNQFHRENDAEDDADGLYECPPNEQPSKYNKHSILPAADSPNISRRPLPLPNDGIERQSLLNVSVPVETVDEDDEDHPNIYDRVDEQKTNTTSRYVSSANVKNEPSFQSIQRKYTFNDSGMDRDKRPLNFLGSLGNIGKYIVDKYKSTKDTSNYENHTFQTDVPSYPMNINSYSFKDRPLPEIPNNHIIDKGIKKSSSFSEITKRENGKNVEVTKDLPKKPLLQIDNDNDAEEKEEDVIYENLNEKTRKICSYEPDLYENNETLRSTSNTSDKPYLPKHQFLRDSLAYKLSEALKARDLTIKAESRDAPEKSNFSKLPISEPADEETQLIYGNVVETDQLEADEPFEKEAEQEEDEQEEYIDSIFNINNEQFFRNIDRKGAKRLLANLTDGAFLFRPSEKYFLVLTIKFNGKFHNLGIERRANNKIRLNADMNSISPEFGTMRAFVDYFTKEPVSFKESNGNLVEVYLNPVLPADAY